MNNRGLSKSCFLLYLISVASVPTMGATQHENNASETIQSPNLRVELNTGHYSYRVVENSTGEELLAETGAVSFTSNGYTIRSVSDVTKGDGWLKAILHLDGTSEAAQLGLRFISPQVLQVTLSFKNGVAAEMREEFEDHGEHYYGIWEMPFGGNLDNRGADHDFLGIRRQPDVNYSSARAPFYVTSRKYGVYVESVGKGRFAVARNGKTSFSFFDNQLRYDIIYGPTYANVLRCYNLLAGPTVMPPTWAFASIWWRDDHHEDLRRARNAQEKVIEDADKLRELQIPAGAIWLDRPFGTGEMGWGNMDFDNSFPDPPKMVQDLHARGMNLLIWVANRAWNQLQTEGAARRYLYFGRGSAADMKDPHAYEWFKDKLNEYVRLGIKGYKIDRGEEDEMPLEDENINAVLFPKMAAEGLAASNGNDFFDFTRNVNDTARRYTAVWNGDTRCTFAGLEVSIKNGLRSSALNFPMWGSDTGGYIRVPDKELFARWLEFSAFSPMMEILIGPKRTLWDDYDTELVDIARKYAGLHHDLIPYTRSYLYQARQTGMSVMRPLIFAYPNEERFADAWDEYLYGENLLIAPVTSQGAVSRKVELPPGRWMNYNEGDGVSDGGTVSVSAPLGTIPVFVREGAIVPRGDIIQANNNWQSNWRARLRIEVFPAEKESSEFDYFDGKASDKIQVRPSKERLTIQVDNLNAETVLEIHCRHFKDAALNGTKLRPRNGYNFDEKSHKLTIAVQGAAKLEVTGAVSMFAR